MLCIKLKVLLRSRVNWICRKGARDKVALTEDIVRSSGFRLCARPGFSLSNVALAACLLNPCFEYDANY